MNPSTPSHQNPKFPNSKMLRRGLFAIVVVLSVFFASRMSWKDDDRSMSTVEAEHDPSAGLVSLGGPSAKMDESKIESEIKVSENDVVTLNSREVPRLKGDETSRPTLTQKTTFQQLQKRMRGVRSPSMELVISDAVEQENATVIVIKAETFV